ncbi:hypothetical protein HHK36_021013 [Tetracentron sinense]|uniref:Uncharacterized protein n=1 Tax=Tetracentron sinense TaxID=13715 RepID=A0A835D7F3_TETSI|nr:hypothetical protein HHK36_021013 [Tetracentron sinense]
MLPTFPYLRFYLCNNSFHGQIPATLGHLRRLRRIILENNQLEGIIPSSLAQYCRKLQDVSLRNNHLQGNIPVEMGNLLDLQILDVSKNDLRDNIPSTIFNISTLQFISVSYNSLSNSIPKDMCHNLLILESVIINSVVRIPPVYVNAKVLDTSISGRIISQEAYQETLDPYLREIPHQLAHLSNVRVLHIAFNDLSGEIPQVIFNISLVRHLAFQENHLSGHVPELTGLWHPNLEELLPQGNQFSGKIPDSISNASKLTLLELSNNFFSGSVPTTLGNLQWAIFNSFEHSI